jgi:hypothetical protein
LRQNLKRWNVTVSDVGDSSKISEIVTSEYYLFEPSAYEKYAQHVQHNRFCIARAVGATQEAHFHVLLPPFAASRNC